MTDTNILGVARHIDPNIGAQDISPLPGGFSSQAYRVDARDRTFVLLVKRPDRISTVDYAHTYVVLKLLQDHHFKHSPEPLWLADDYAAMAMSIFDGVSSDVFDFVSTGIDPEQLSVAVMDSLLDVGSITTDEYKQMATTVGITSLPIQSPEDSAQKYGIERFEIVKKFCPDEDIVDWLEPRIERSVETAKTMGTNEVAFGHGDPSNPNILIKSSGSFMLIDWGSARFHCSGPEFLIAYTTHLTNFMKPFRQTLINHVAARIGMPSEELARRVLDFRRYNEVFDVNWAAMMMAKVSIGEVSGDIEEFRKIARERIGTYEESFGK